MKFWVRISSGSLDLQVGRSGHIFALRTRPSGSLCAQVGRSPNCGSRLLFVFTMDVWDPTFAVLNTTFLQSDHMLTDQGGR